MLGEDGLGQPRDRLLVTQIAGQHPGSAACRVHLGGQGCETVLVAGGEQQVLPTCGQLKADGAAHATARPGDQDHR